MSAAKPSDALRARILAAAQAEAVPTRAEARRTTWLTVAVGFVIEAVAFGSIARHHQNGTVNGLRLGMFTGALVVALASTVLAFGRGRSMVGRPRAVLLAIAVAVPALLVAWMAAMHATATAEQLAAYGQAQLHVCFELTMLFSLGPVGALLWARRGSDPVHPASTAAAIGAAGGAWATVAISVLCPIVDFAHVAIAHCLPAAVLAFVAAWIGLRLLALRPRQATSA